MVLKYLMKNLLCRFNYHPLREVRLYKTKSSNKEVFGRWTCSYCKKQFGRFKPLNAELIKQSKS